MMVIHIQGFACENIVLLQEIGLNRPYILRIGFSLK